MQKHLFRIAAVAALQFALLAATAYAQNISTIAGGGPDNVPATSAAIGVPWAVVQDGNGNTYISDNLSNRIFKVNGGTLTVFAGDIVSGGPNSNFGGGVPATEVTLNSPKGIALDANGNLYIADTGNNVVRVVNTQTSSATIATVQVNAGSMVTIAGNAASCGTPTGGCGDAGPATSANLSSPSGVWLDGSGNIYIADTLDNKIREVNASTGVITTVAGNGGAGYTGDGAAATAEELNNPQGVIIDSSGALIIADGANYRIRAVNTNSSGSITVLGVSVAAGKIQTIAGNGSQCTTGSALCGDGSPATGPGAELNAPAAVFEDGSGNLYIADTNDNVIRLVTNSSPFDISTIAGSNAGSPCGAPNCGDGSAPTSAQLWAPTGVFVSGSNVLIADQNDDAVRQSNGTAMSTIAGVLTTGQPFNTAFSGDGSAATSASVRSPVGVAADSSGNLYIADTLNDVIRKVDASSGDISTIAGAGDLPCYGSAGLGQPCGDGGAATAAEFSFPTDVFLDASGNIYIADYDPSFVSVIREIVASTGNIKTVAGVYSRPGYSGDNGPATAAQLSGDCSSCSSRLSIAVDKAGVLYIADTGNNVIRAVNTNASGSVKVAGVTIAAGNIATIAGVQSTPCASATSACGDGGAATAASLNAPGGVAVDSDGNIYISDSNDNRVRIVNSTGTINKFAGTGTACTSSCGDGGPATAANLDVPQHVMVDFAGNVYIADSADYEIREVTVSDGTINAVVDSSQTHGFGGDGGTATAALLASPYGLAADGSGNLYISDIQQWRIRKVTNQVLTAPTATLSTSSISFPSEGTGVASPAQNVTIKNNGFGTALAISKVAIGGTDTKDFAISSNACGSSLLAGSSCTIGVTFTPTTTGSRSATLTITDNASGGSQNVSLTGTGLAESFTIPKPATPAPISAGSSATYTISISPVNGFNGSVTLSCTKGLPTGASCSFSPSSIKPGTNSTLTISTTGPTSGALTAPAVRQQSAPMFAMWLLLPAMLLSTAGMSTAQRKKLISYLLLTLAIAGVLFLVACGGGSSSTPTPTGGTPSGTYTVTVQGTAGALNATTTVTLTVQ